MLDMVFRPRHSVNIQFTILEENLLQKSLACFQNSGNKSGYSHEEMKIFTNISRCFGDSLPNSVCQLFAKQLQPSKMLTSQTFPVFRLNLLLVCS